jgi:hypothetical protein
MDNNETFIFVACVMGVGLVLVWLYHHRRQPENTDKENFSYTEGCKTKCSKSSGSWANLKLSCDRLGGKYEKCGNKDIFGNRKGRRCVNYTDPNTRDGSCNSIDDRFL